MNFISNASSWAMGQAGSAIAVVVLFVAVLMYIQRRILAMIGTLIGGGVLAMLAYGGPGMWQSIGSGFKTILGI